MNILLKPRWIVFHILVLVLSLLFIRLGIWQWHRHLNRQASNAIIRERLDLPAEDYLSLKQQGLKLEDANVQHSSLYRRVRITGLYEPDKQVYIRNRSYQGQPGYHLLTPLRLEHGEQLLIERGWIPIDQPEVTTPRGEVLLEGVLFATQHQPTGSIGAKDPPTGALKEIVWIDRERLSEQMGGNLEPVYLRLTKQEPAQEGDLPIYPALPNLDIGSHLGYMIQWFGFALIAIIGYLALMRSLIRNQAS
ncbi:MAG: SURF1 family protein [Deinococcales bacterium]